MTTSAPSWPHDGVWPTFQEKKWKGQGKKGAANPTRGTLVSSLCIPFIDHLSRDTSGFVCGLIGTCELCYLDYELC